MKNNKDINFEYLNNFSSLLKKDKINNISIYLAGPLFSFADLFYNSFIQKEVYKLSQGMIRIILPQDISKNIIDKKTTCSQDIKKIYKEFRILEKKYLWKKYIKEEEFAVQIKNSDLSLVASCDMIIANADLREFDSGTVVELISSRVLKKPGIIMRTDFRKEPEDPKSKDKFLSINLMLYNLPLIENLDFTNYFFLIEKNNLSFIKEKFILKIILKIISVYEKYSKTIIQNRKENKEKISNFFKTFCK